MTESIPSRIRIVEIPGQLEPNPDSPATCLDQGLRDTETAVTATLGSEPEERVSFEEAADMLGEKLDLNATLAAAVKAHGRWQLVTPVLTKLREHLEKAQSDYMVNPYSTAHRRNTDSNSYEALLKAATINQSDFAEVRKKLERGEKILPIFDPGILTIAELYTVLFAQDKLPGFVYAHEEIIEFLAKIRRISPKDIVHLSELSGKTANEQFAALSAAYAQAAPLEPIGPRIIFTADELKAKDEKLSVFDYLQILGESHSTHFIDPLADLLRFRTQLDAGLREIVGEKFDSMSDDDYRLVLQKAYQGRQLAPYIPDFGLATIYPNYVSPRGGILAIEFNQKDQKLHVDDLPPGCAGQYSGIRFRLG